MLNIILLTIIVLSLAVIIGIAGRHWHELVVIKTDTIPIEPDKMLKSFLVGNRIARSLKKKLGPFGVLWDKVYDLMHNVWHKWYSKVEYIFEREKNKHYTPQSIERLAADIENLLDEARTLADGGKITEAEKKFLEVVKLDPKNVEAYRGLGDLYYSKKQYNEAREIYKFLIKLNSVSVNRKSDYFFNLALIYKAENELGEALNYGLKAIDLVPNSPRYLDFIIDLSIIEGDKVGARRHLVKLKEVNPENQKIAVWEEQL